MMLMIHDPFSARATPSSSLTLRSPRYLLCLVLALALAVLLTGCGEAPPVRSLRGAITDGVADSGHHAVGKLVGGNGYCTATLIRKRVIVTAAHCVDPDKMHTFSTEGQSYDSLEVLMPPGWDPSSSAVSLHDIAVLHLDRDAHVAPAPVSAQAVTTGMPVTLVGWGRTGDNEPIADHRRTATNQIDQVEPLRFRFSGTGGASGSTCDGDSGSPAFASIGGKEVVVGVTSSASDKGCGIHTWDTRVDAHDAWLKSVSDGHVIGADKLPPTVSILTPTNGVTLPSWSFVVKAQITDNRPGTTAALFVDGALVEEQPTAPFIFTIDGCVEGSCGTPSPSTHTVKVVGRDAAGNTGQAQLSININATATPPAPAEADAGGGPVRQDPPPGGGQSFPGQQPTEPDPDDSSDADGGGCRVAPVAPSARGLAWLLGLLCWAGWRRRSRQGRARC